MRTSEVAARARVNPQTLRYYERVGLLQDPGRTTSGYRDYPDKAVAWVRFIKRAQRVGFRLDEVETLLHLGESSSDCAAARALAVGKLADLGDQVEELEAMRRSLARLVEGATTSAMPPAARSSRTSAATRGTGMTRETSTGRRSDPVHADSASVRPGARQIGPWGMSVRLAAGLLLLAWGLVVPHRHPWLDLPLAGSRTWGAVAGLLIVPALLTAALRLRGRDAPPLNVCGYHVACWLALPVVLIAQVIPVTVLVYLGASLLLLAARGDDGCELLAPSNLLLRRRDYLVCLPFSPVDRWETARAEGARDGETSRAGRRR